ncbi:hypothetical protein GCM10010140_76810 [Streptosporangium pseudovulgare]|uniref:Uncharacterized protein n=1 Tax=Streptosporangium pseudovulgare TaxID=35765 RepID=A0ABQ2RP56_9ACTN|nr:hypothetical protein GCM10010140_76810 [Streptosporangium pseudovulgare]
MRGARPEGEAAGRRVSEHSAEREHVRRGLRLFAHDVFRGHETGRAYGHSGAGELRVLRGPCDAEIDQAGAIRCQQYISGLQIAVHYLAVVYGRQPFREPGGQQPQRVFRQRTVLADGLLRRRARNIGGGQPRRVRLRVRVHHLRGVEAADPLCGRYLTGEPPPEVGVRGKLRPHHLHGDPPATTGTAQEHLPHPAPAQSLQQPVRPDLPWIPGPQIPHATSHNRRAPRRPAGARSHHTY